MLIEDIKAKRANMILYFLDNAEINSIHKLYWLMYLADFIHFSEIGHSITRFKYYNLDNELFPKKLDSDLRKGRKYNKYFSVTIFGVDYGFEISIMPIIDFSK